MKIILNQDVHNLGEEGDVVEVKNGYARNFLLPKHFAVLFNKANQAIFAGKAKAIEKRKEDKRKAASTLRERLDSMTLTLTVSAGESGKLFGSVTNTMIMEGLAKEGIEIEKKRIEVASHDIKMVGTYTVKIRLYEGESASLKLEVLSEKAVKDSAARKAAEEAAEVKAAPQVAEEPVAVVEESAFEAGEETETEDDKE
ncbi:MAG: 50S ribosomal protein L9 [Sphaerochaetaceae bacterium]|nr:50S ribosomal protein L9 [Sphaerochaetaceae bacterium]